LITVLGANGVPTQPFATRMIPPASRMGPLSAAELAPHLDTAQIKKYALAVDRESAREALSVHAGEPTPSNADAAPGRARRPQAESSALEKILKSPLTRSVATQVTRSLMGALFGPTRRRRY